MIKDDLGDAGDKIDWKWKRGSAFSHAAVGDPRTSEAFSLCIYDSTSGVVTSAAGLELEPNASWSDQAPKGWLYDDPPATFDGLRQIRLTAGVEGRSSVRLRAGGLSVPMPSPASAASFFSQDPLVIVQLVASSQTSSLCWSSEFTQAATRRNDASRFKASAGPKTLPPKRVFASSQCYDGNLDGIGGADARCQAHADAAQLGGTFAAWIADSLDAPVTRFTRSHGAYLRTDGAMVAENWSDLVDGTLSTAIDVDENGDTIDIGAGCADEVWTNVTTGGSVAVADGYEFVCQEWSIALFARSAPTGRASAIDATWTDAGAFGRQACNRLARLYCFEQ